MTKNYKNGYAKNKRVRFGSYFIVCFRGGGPSFSKTDGFIDPRYTAYCLWSFLYL